jgi:hypothetical protein
VHKEDREVCGEGKLAENTRKSFIMCRSQKDVVATTVMAYTPSYVHGCRNDGWAKL